MLNLEVIVLVLKYVVIASVFFVWVVRYENIIKEFKDYNLPNWLRDLVGILKLSSAAMLFSDYTQVVFIGASLIVLLMVAAMVTHLRIKNPFSKMIPSVTLFLFALLIASRNMG